ncbi:MAG: electron transport complex subunit RsxB [Pseudomonadota bacterium]|nr:electron transport complex subunit RsxB [Pseudomonadota bacterium]
MLTAIAAIAALAVAFGLLLGYSAIRFHIEGDPIADQVDSILPQTQCGQCGYPGCRPYAEAVAKEDEAINKCVPGGEAVVMALADLLGKEPVAVDGAAEKPKAIAVIDEKECIGCTLCIQACPVDAILGAAKQLHGIIASECTGCELCLKPCPVECIHMVPIPEEAGNWKWPFPASRPEALPQPAAA